MDSVSLIAFVQWFSWHTSCYWLINYPHFSLALLLLFLAHMHACSLNGGELFDYVVEREFLEESQAVNYLTQILEAMAFCHERSIIHLDLKVTVRY